MGQRRGSDTDVRVVCKGSRGGSETQDVCCLVVPCADWMVACEQDEELIELFGDGKGGPGDVTAVRVVRDAKTSVGKVHRMHTKLCTEYSCPAARVPCLEAFAAGFT